MSRIDLILLLRKAAACAAAVLLWAASAQASQDPVPPEAAKKTPQDRDLTELSLEELMGLKIDEVYTASRYVQKISDAPASVTVITVSEIRKFGYRTVADVLKAVRGVYVTNDRNYSYVGVRGFGLPEGYNNRILVLVDGHRINSAIYGQALLAEDFVLDLDLVERIEFVRGPGSSLYGSNAFFAVINVMTRKGRSLQGPEAAVTIGGFGSTKGRFTFAKTFESGLDLLLSSSLYNMQGQTFFYPEFNSPSTNSGFAPDADGEYAYSAFARLGYKEWTLQAAYVVREKDLPTAPYGTVFPSRTTASWDSQGYVDLSYDHAFPQKLDLKVRAFADTSWYLGNFEYLDAGLNSYVNKDRALSYTWGSEIQLIQPLFEDKLKLTAGGELRHNFHQRMQNFDVGGPGGSYLDTDSHTLVLAGFAQAEVSILDNLRANVGVRYDSYDTFGSSVSPRAALIYTPFEGTTVKALYGQAFRAPSPFELYYNDGGQTWNANPNLGPEKIATYEIEIEQDLGKDFRIIGSGFYYECSDLITLQTDSGGILFFDNVNRARTVGGGVELQGRFENGIEGRLSYTYASAENAATGIWLVNSPRHVAKANVSVPIVREKAFASLELQYLGKRISSQITSVADYMVANVTFYARDLAPGLDLSASIYNLFNGRYFDSGGPEHTQAQIQQDGISFAIKLTYRF